MKDTMTDPTPDRPAESDARHYSRGNPVRNLRLDDTRWNAINNLATRTGTTASAVIRDALDAWLDRRP